MTPPKPVPLGQPRARTDAFCSAPRCLPADASSLQRRRASDTPSRSPPQTAASLGTSELKASNWSAADVQRSVSVTAHSAPVRGCRMRGVWDSGSQRQEG